ncbi:MAG: GNAT family N-acetyltransferase [Miltoncostaeaceae bacterium]
MNPSGAPNPAVRVATPADAGEMGALLMDGLGEKFRPALGRRGAGRLGALLHREISRGEDYYVAVDADGLTGVAHLDLGRHGSPASVRELAAALGWPRTAWALMVWSLIDAGRRRPDDAYIEEVVVAERARRRGLGVALLDACERSARDARCASVRLIVVWENAGAIALYRSHGYAVIARKRWWLGRLVYGSSGAFLMEKPLGA